MKKPHIDHSRKYVSLKISNGIIIKLPVELLQTLLLENSKKRQEQKCVIKQIDSDLGQLFGKLNDVVDSTNLSSTLFYSIEDLIKSYENNHDDSFIKYIPLILETSDNNISIPIDNFFEDINKKFTRQGALLKGLRYRENLTQKEFAKKITVTQGDLSKMERGTRPIGKQIAKRIEKVFGTNHKLFLLCD